MRSASSSKPRTKAGRPISRTIRLTAYDVLVVTNRGTGGRAYELLAGAFERRGFNIIDHWKIIERNPATSRMVAI